MTTDQPFPADLAELSAVNAERSREERYEPGTGDHKIYGVACFRLDDGTTRPAYDLYQPTFPRDAEPGIGTLTCCLRHYPNDSDGYEITVSDFVPASDLLEHTDPWSNPLVLFDAVEETFVVASDIDAVERAGDTDNLLVPSRIYKHGLDDGDVPDAYYLIHCRGRREVHIAPDAETLMHGIKTLLHHDMIADDDPVATMRASVANQQEKRRKFVPELRVAFATSSEVRVLDLDQPELDVEEPSVTP